MLHVPIIRLIMGVALIGLLSACSTSFGRFEVLVYGANGSPGAQRPITLQVGETARGVSNLEWKGDYHCTRYSCGHDYSSNKTLQSEWTSSNTDVITLRPLYSSNAMRLDAVAPGVSDVCALYERARRCVKVTVRP